MLSGREEEILELVGDLGNVGESEHQRRAFDAVCLAHRLGDGVQRTGRLLEAQQGRAQRLDAVAGLFDEFPNEDRRIERFHLGSQPRRVE